MMIMPPADRRFCEGVRGTPSSGMQYLHLKLHLVVILVMRVLVMIVNVVIISIIRIVVIIVN